MAMKSKYNSKCKACGNLIRKDIDWIEPKVVTGYPSTQWVHVQCPADGQSALGTSVKTASNYRGRQFAQIVPSINDPQPIVDDIGDGLADAIEASLHEIEAPAVRSFIPSKYQQAIFDAIQAMVDKVADFRHLVIEAVAGSGKTTTIEQSLKLIPIEYLVAFVAFNKHIAAELARRCQSAGLSNVMASTLHSLGSTNLKKYFPKIKLEKDKVGRLMDDIYPVSKQALDDGLIDRDTQKTNRAKRMMMRKLVAICKNTLIDVSNRKEIMMAIDKYGIEIDMAFQDEIIGNLPIVIDRCKEDVSFMDFDDMLWMPIALNLDLEKFDFLMVDEFQDMNKCQIVFIMRSIKEDGHIIAVGDRYQSLYGFRGADTDAIPNAIITLDAKVLPLSVTYRCPVSHVRLAQEIVPEIEPREGAPEGTVIELDYFQLASAVKQGDMIICRTNAPLVKPAFECIRMGKKAMIRGVDVGDSLINLIKRFETNDLGQFEISLMEYYEHEYTKLMNYGKEMQALLLQDRVDTLRFIVNECGTVAELMSKIEMLFSDTNTGIVFSSVHRAKGLEAETVYLLRPELLPHPKAKRDWEQDQEMNCKYVALTRSKDTLVFVKGGENI